MNWIKKNIINIILSLVFVIGLCLLLYPTVSNYWNSFHQSRAIASYAETVADMNDAEYDKMLDKARAYNDKLAKSGMKWNLTKAEEKEYNSILDVTETGAMGYIEIDKINCSLPIYHGTADTVLQIAIGHIAGSSLPIGGKSTHAVLSGHRGLPSAKLFTDLDKLEKGDTFVIRVLDETLTYEVDQIRIVEPDNLADLKIVEGEDLCTLVTCTPYGINTHRLLVRGHRVSNAADADGIRVTADAIQIEPILVAPIIGAVMIILLLIGFMIHSARSKKRRR